MLRYSILSSIFVAASLLAVVVISRLRNIQFKQMLLITIGMLFLTLIFDNLIIGMHIVTYSSQHILGIYLGKVPIEDFAYTLVAGTLIPSIWVIGKRND